jgi:uncharacterized protein YkwD
MKRFWMLTSLLFLTLGLFPSEQAGARPVYFSPNFAATELIAEVNDLRVAENLPPYKTNSILMTIAQSQADRIASTGVMTHFDASGARPFQRAIKAGYSVTGDLSQGGLLFENIGSGAGLTASGVVGIWQADEKDLKTLLSADLKDVGAGVAVAGGVTYFVLDAGASADVSATPSLSVVGTQPVALIISTPLEDGSVYHQVKANEALWSIALNYNTTVENLKFLNRLATNDIYEGQNLLVRKPEAKTATPTVMPTATFGIPTSTATQPVVPTATPTATPLPVSPTSRQSGEMVVGIIILVALIAVGIGAWLGSKKTKLDS